MVSCGPGRPPGPVYRKITGQAGPYGYEVVYAGDTTDYAPSIDSIFALIHATFSPEVEGSVVWKFNRFDRTDTLFCFKDSLYLFGTVYDLTKDISIKTQGYLDPTIGPLQQEWAKNPQGPDLDSLYAFMGFTESLIDMIEMTDSAGQYRETQLRKADPRMRLDFGKLPYAYGLDMVRSFLQENDLVDFRLVLDDIVLCQGFADNPLSVFPLTTESDSVRVLNRAAAFRDSEDKKRLMDPAYGYPVSADDENSIEALYVLTEGAAMAEGYSRAFMIMNVPGINDFYLQHPEAPVEVLVIYKPEGQWDKAVTQGFEQAIIHKSTPEGEEVP